MLDLRIITAEESLFEAQVQAAFFPGVMGEFEILPRHAAFLSALESGDIRIRQADGAETGISIKSGFVKVEDDKIVACVAK